MVRKVTRGCRRHLSRACNASGHAAVPTATPGRGRCHDEPSCRSGGRGPGRPSMSRATQIVARRRPSRRRARNLPARGAGTRVGVALGSVLAVTAVLLAIVTLASVSAFGIMASGLPDPSDLDRLAFAQPTVLYDRAGNVELGRFEQERRKVVDFAEVPARVLDATTAAEDRTFWENPGIDPAALVAAVAEGASGAGERGASTITQQLVRARLLPADVVAPGSDRYVRKIKEIIQSLRLTDTFPGEAGKQRIITAYLNEVFYGHGAYGIAAAARIYFGVELDGLSVAQAALLAGLVKSPSTLDPYLAAKPDADGRLVVPPSAVRGRPARLDPARHGPVRSLEPALGGRPPCGAGRTRRPRRPAAGHEPRRPVHLAGAPPAGRHPRARRRPRDRRLPGDHHDGLAGPAAGRTLADGRPHRAEPVAQEGQRPARRSQGAGPRPSLDQGPARQGPAQRRARGPRLSDRRRAGLCGQRRLRARRPGERRFRAQVRRRRRRGAPARVGVQAGPVCGRVRGPQAFARQPAPGRHDDLRSSPGLGPARCRPAGSRPGARPPRAPVLAEHPGDPRTRAGRQRPGRRHGGGHGRAFRRRQEGLPAGRPGRRPRDRRGHAARPDHRLRHVGQRRDAPAAADDPGDRRPRRPGRVAGGPPSGRERRLGPDRVPRDRHPRRQYRPEAEPHLGQAAGAVQRQGRQATARGRQDRHDQRCPRPRHVWVPAAAAGRRARPGRRHLDRQQRPLVPEDAHAGHLAHGRRAAVARLRPRLHQGLERDVLQATEGPGLRAHRRLVRRTARPLDAGHDQGVVHQGHPARERPRRSTRTACSTGGCAAAGGWIRCRPSSGPRRGGPTSRTGCVGRDGVAASSGALGSRTAVFWGERSWGGSLAGACPAPRPQHPGHGHGNGNGRGHGGGRGHGKPPGGPDPTPLPTAPPTAPATPL